MIRGRMYPNLCAVSPRVVRATSCESLLGRRVTTAWWGRVDRCQSRDAPSMRPRGLDGLAGTGGRWRIDDQRSRCMDNPPPA